VSAPVSWDEVAAVAASADAASLAFETADVLERVDQLGDLYAQDPGAQDLPALA